MPNQNYRLVAFASLAYLVSQANLARLLGPLEPSIFALQLAFTPGQFWAVVGQWGAAGVARYQAHFGYDFVHPFIYAWLGYVWVRRTPLFARLGRRGAGFFALALPVAGACDLLENLLHLHLLGLAPGSGGALVTLAAFASSIKWSLALLFTLVLLACLGLAGWRRARPA